MNRTMKLTRQNGFSILEILVAILMFAIGMLALASLQGSLTRSSADANLRTTAANIAERTIEDLRGFGRIDTDPAGTVNAYADIASGTSTVTDGSLPFTRTIAVTDYYYDLATDTFTTTAPTGVAYSDFKEVTVTVAWGADSGFETDDANTISSADLGTGSITASAFVSSASTQGSATATTQDEDNDFEPFVNYTPGANPDIVSLTLDTSKFKESLTPAPEVIRLDDYVETRFDVITYSQTNNASLFLRREEFIAVSCLCTLNDAPAGGAATGRRPTLWAGDEYTEPEFVAKAYGTSANNSQSSFCTTCCQDHHDGGSGSNDPVNDAGAILYNPYRPPSEYLTNSGNHKHYKKDNRGNLSVASAGDDYVEACRLVRKDGFFRVAQDFSMEGLNTFPYDYLVNTADVASYSAWLTGAVSVFTDAVVTDDYDYTFLNGFSPPEPLEIPRRYGPDDTVNDNDLTAAYTSLPTPLRQDYQQLRSRGIYIDYMTTDLRGMLACLGETDPPDIDDCNTRDFGDVKLDKTGSGNALEIIPFFEVQLTYLNNWTINPVDGPVSVTNEPLETDNTHDRGTAEKQADTGNSIVTATGHTGVLGFTDTDPIDPYYGNNLTPATIEVVITGDDTSSSNGKVVTAIFTSAVNGVQARNVEITSSGASCNRTNEGFSCLIPTGTTGATVTLSNYFKQNDNNISACSDDITLPGSTAFNSSNRPTTTFSLDPALDEGTIVYQISIVPGSCGA